MAVRLSASIFIGLALESFFYGAFIMIFIAAVITQRERWKVEKLRTGNKLVMGFSILLLVFISTHWIINIWRCYVVFLSGSDLATMDDMFANQRDGASLARFIVYEIQAWMGDCLLIYRLYHVCGRRWSIVAVPCTMCSALVVCGVCLLKSTVTLNFLDPGSMKPFHTWAIVCFALTFGENIYCLVAIAFFIWRAQYDVRYVTTSPLTAVMWIFVESAGMWLLFVALTFFTYLGDPVLSVAFVYIANPTLGISFCLMVTRLNLHSQKRNRISSDIDARQSQGIGFTPASLYLPQPRNAPSIPSLYGSKREESFLSTSLP